jgi:hypothetical protein
MSLTYKRNSRGPKIEPWGTPMLMSHEFISIDQSAYLKNHSTQTSLHRVIDDWLENTNNGLLTGACFLDIQNVLIPLITPFY